MQSTSYLMMIRPSGFAPNPQILATYGGRPAAIPADLQQRALKEFEALVHLLRANDINVLVFEDVERNPSPDALFPSDWVSFHSNGNAVLYPLESALRRGERRRDILELLKRQFILRNIIDLTHHEEKGRFLEGTGSMALDRANRVAYACLSTCTHPQVLSNFCSMLQYRSVTFQAADEQQRPIRHTDSIMSIGSRHVLVCLDAVSLSFDKDILLQEFKKAQKEVIEVRYDQVKHYCCSVIEVINNTGTHFMVMSTGAYEALNEGQRRVLERYAKVLHTPLDTIEQYGNGSVRAMLAEIHLPTL